MSAVKDGGPAFPRPFFENAAGEWSSAQDGMSLRDWFAGQSLLVLVDNPPKNTEVKEWINERATYAYLYADAMLKAREVTS